MEAEGEALVEKVMKARAREDLDSICEQKHDPGLTVFLGADGIHTPMRKRSTKKGCKSGKVYKESKVGCVYVVNAVGRILQRHYVYHMGSPAGFGKKLYALVVALGLAEIARVVAFGDGAPWIWRQIRIYFPHAIQVLDWYHVTEHLYGTAAVCFGEASSEAQALATREAQKGVDKEQQLGILKDVDDIVLGGVSGTEEVKPVKQMAETRVWVKQVEGLLIKGKLGEVIEKIKSLPRAGKLAINSVRRLVNYLTKNAERLKYDEYQEKGHWIGLGHNRPWLAWPPPCCNSRLLTYTQIVGCKSFGRPCIGVILRALRANLIKGGERRQCVVTGILTAEPVP